MNRYKKLTIKYLVTIFIGLVFLLSTLSLADYWNPEQTDEYKLKYLANAFTIPGVLLVSFGALIWLSNEGALRGISYSVKHAVGMLIPGGKKHEKYGDYVARQKKTTGYSCIFIVGLAFLIVAIILTSLYMNRY